uniref:Uncharacterized protein n=1 Tax=Arundo donax TaxID=35708 RepID=A0A0A9GZE6_ARUDO
MLPPLALKKQVRSSKLICYYSPDPLSLKQEKYKQQEIAQQNFYYTKPKGTRT